MNNEYRPSWLPSGPHCIIPSAFVDEMQETLHVLITAQRTGDAELASAALIQLAQSINIDIGQPAIQRVAG